MMRKYYVTFSEKNLTGNAGLVHLGRFAEKLGIQKMLDKILTIQRAPNTVKKYLQILESLYIIFRVHPFSRNIARSILKEPKIYFFDTGLVKGDEGAKFENMTALCLLKHVYGLVDFQGRPYALNYLRTKDKKEVDFCIVNDDKPELLIEVKRSDPKPADALLYFTNKYGIPCMQLVLRLKREKQNSGVEVRRGMDYLKSLLI